jgi:hypothetical protein
MSFGCVAQDGFGTMKVFGINISGMTNISHKKIFNVWH